MNEILDKKIPVPKTFSIEAQDILKKLLMKDPAQRLGCRAKGPKEI